MTGILIIAATNSYNSLDAALIRPGRFDLKYNIGNPDRTTRLGLIEFYTKNKNLDNTVNKEKLSDAFENLSSSAIETILNEAGALTVINKKDKISLEDIIAASVKTNCSINVNKLK